MRSHTEDCTHLWAFASRQRTWTRKEARALGIDGRVAKKIEHCKKIGKERCLASNKKYSARIERVRNKT